MTSPDDSQEMDSLLSDDRRHDSADARQIVLVVDGDVESCLFDSGARDNCHEPGIILRQEAQRRGFEMVAARGNPSKSARRILHWDGAIAARLVRERRTVRGKLGSLRRRVLGRTPDWAAYASVPWGDERVSLILFEPAVISPANYEPQVLDKFGTILTWNDDLVDGARFHKYRIPVPHAPLMPECPVPFADKRLCVNISGNKFSAHPKELYSARRQSIRYFEARFPEQFDLFGVGWGQASTDPAASVLDRRPYPSFRGTVETKVETLKHYKFALCYENSAGPRGYVTEKIFDCLRSDCVPIYMGAPNIGEYVDEEAFVDRREFASDEQLADFLVEMKESEYRQYRDAALRYLESARFSRFLPEAFANDVLATLRIDDPAAVTSEVTRS